MLLRHRVSMLRLVAVRSVTFSQSTSPSPAEPPASPANEVKNPPQMNSSTDAKATRGAATHHSPVQANASRKMYSKEGYNFIEHLRTSGPGAALGRVRWTLSVYVLIASVTVLYLGYYLTTYTYVLTTNPAPHRNSLFQHFPCDLAIIENKFTGKRHTVEVAPAISPRLVDGPAAGDAVEALDSTSAASSFVRPAPAIVERRLHINSILHRVYLYLQKSHSLVLVNAQAELDPNRFRYRSNSVGQDARAPLGFLREDQLLPEPQEKGKHDEQSRGWMFWKSKPEAASVRSHPHVSSSKSDASAAAPAPKQLLIESEVRLRDAMNGYQKGHLYTYEQTMTHLVQEKLEKRFYAFILERGMSEQKGLRKVYAEEMIRNGLISGAGVTLPQLVPDVSQFADEVFDDMKARFGDDVIIYNYSVKLH